MMSVLSKQKRDVLILDMADSSLLIVTFFQNIPGFSKLADSFDKALDRIGIGD
ncbi:MAG: hypothetical protein MOB07_26870 [Acidobacteria bacterium]|nr:hypothetical protein [Acidobacteriota bacterium]